MMGTFYTIECIPVSISEDNHEAWGCWIGQNDPESSITVISVEQLQQRIL